MTHLARLLLALCYLLGLVATMRLSRLAWQEVSTDMPAWRVQAIAGVMGQTLLVLGCIALWLMLVWGSWTTRRSIKTRTGRSEHDLPASHPKE